jgi:hypothetical protein
VAITVYVWDREDPEAGTYTEAVVADEPAVNATVSHRIGGDVKELVVEAWRRAHPGESRGLDEFVFRAPPRRWENPNDQRPEVGAVQE